MDLDAARAVTPSQPVPSGLDVARVEKLARRLYERVRSSYRRDMKPTWDEMLADRAAPWDRRHPYKSTNGGMIDQWREEAARLLSWMEADR